MRRLFAQLVVFMVGAVALVGLGGVSTLLATRQDARTPAADSTTLAGVRAQLADSRRELERAHQILEFSGQYAIPADLSARIYDIAIAEGIPAAVGFQLVKVESGFQNGATSSAAAIGLTQVRLPTARTYDAMVDPSDLMNADVNLRLGFRYLKDLLDRFDDNLPLALEAYNKGPTFVAAEQVAGNTVEGRYSRAVMSGVRKKG
ncbi:MAG TPA: transglycosylase SLT domain-containing protein [Gemmatimonadales bacterium]|jgi:soluble lytic murein transglycosylase-like protein